MLKRFSLYGFLKNQQYFQPFFVLAFLQMGLNFTTIGLLVAFREVMVSVMEIPTGGIADVFGRRRSMMVSMVAYIASFAVFGGAGLAATEGQAGLPVLLPLLMVAMFCFAVGDAFRTGTHKAMIFTWLRGQGRESERTKIYGYTRSWSKLGSAVSVVLACVFVFVTSNYIYVFFFSIIPYVLNIINFMGYPHNVDVAGTESVSIRSVVRHLKEALVLCVRNANLRRLVLESMGFEGFFKAAKDYLQPILGAAALPLVAAACACTGMTEQQKSVVLIGPVYVLLFLLSAMASRKAHRLVGKAGDEDRTARLLWGVGIGLFVVLLSALYVRIHWLMIAGFVGLHVLQNVWRPVLVSRFDMHGDADKGATILSIESQAKSLSTMIIAPALGLAVDTVKARGIGAGEFWPIGLLGLLICAGFFVTAARGPKAADR